MKRIILALGIIGCFIVSACSNPGGDLPAVTASDRDLALSALGTANQSFSAVGVATASPYTFSIPPYFSGSVTFSPSFGTFGTAPTSSATIVENINNYPDGGTGYTISGTLTCTISCTGSTMTTMTMKGSFTLTGGNVRTMSVDMIVDLSTYSATGSVTVNGQTWVL